MGHISTRDESRFEIQMSRLHHVKFAASKLQDFQTSLESRFPDFQISRFAHFQISRFGSQGPYFKNFRFAAARLSTSQTFSESKRPDFQIADFHIFRYRDSGPKVQISKLQIHSFKIVNFPDFFRFQKIRFPDCRFFQVSRFQLHRVVLCIHHFGVIF